MDQFLKGTATRFSDLPPVRIEVRSSRDKVHEVRWGDSWPPAETTYRSFYLTKGKLELHPPAGPGELTYPSRSGLAYFDLRFDEDTEITGYIKLKAWFEARASNGDRAPKDGVLCCFIEKLNRAGARVRFYGSVGNDKDFVSRGYGRAARRALDHSRSSPYCPVPLNNKDEWLEAGEIVPLEIAFCPSATFFAAGETLRLIIAPRDIVHAPIFRKNTKPNDGDHVIHFGGDYDSALQLPMISVNSQD